MQYAHICNDNLYYGTARRSVSCCRIIVTTAALGNVPKAPPHFGTTLSIVAEVHHVMGYAKDRATRKVNRNAKTTKSDSGSSLEGPTKYSRVGHISPPRLAPASNTPLDDQIYCSHVVAELEETLGYEEQVYIKISPGKDGSSWYLSAHWRWGPYDGHYVMVVVERGRLLDGLSLLSWKITRVRCGTLAPLKDQYRRGRDLA